MLEVVMDFSSILTLGTLGPWGLVGVLGAMILTSYFKSKAQGTVITIPGAPSNSTPTATPTPATIATTGSHVKDIVGKLVENLLSGVAAQSAAPATPVQQPAAKPASSFVDQIEQSISHLALFNAIRSNPEAWAAMTNFVRAHLMQEAKTQAAQADKVA